MQTIKVVLDRKKAEYLLNTYDIKADSNLEEMIRTDEARISEMLELNRHYGVHIDAGIADYMIDALTVYYKWYLDHGTRPKRLECFVNLHTGKIALNDPHDYTYFWRLFLLWNILVISESIIKAIFSWR
jgi:hypothetical protein